MVGRPKEFDEQEALERAMEVFWTYGYEATSVQDLLDAMGIHRGSMYDTFGDKHALFTAAINHYGRTITQCVEDTLDGPGSPLGNIHKLLRRMAGPAADGKCRGCLATNTVIELAPHDPEVAEAVKALLRRVEKAFHRTLERAVESGELSPDANPRALARFLCCTLQGLVVMGKASAGRSTIKDIVKVTLSAMA
ncbi:MAG: TetR/AcrR family transcriptional regulator [Planctomycetes bacterium]|nr:TetR/AcrR family transcriptional regulator [Planctomycetota bacterium]